MRVIGHCPTCQAPILSGTIGTLRFECMCNDREQGVPDGYIGSTINDNCWNI